MKKFTLAALALVVSVCATAKVGHAAPMALKIDKTDDTGLNYFMAPQDASLDALIGSTLTVEAWVKPNEMFADNPCGASYQIVNKESSYEIALRIGADGNPGYPMAAIWPKDGTTWNWVDSTVQVPSGKWSHVAVTWDGTTVRMFVNGKFAAKDDQWGGADGGKTILNIAPNQDATPANPPEPLRIGRRHNSGPCHQLFDGLIDEVRISKVLRYDEKGFEVPTATFTPDADTVALYHFDDSSAAAADVDPIKAKFKTAGIMEDNGQGTQDPSSDPQLDIKGTSKDASTYHNDGALIGKAVLVPSDIPLKDATTP